MEKSAKYRTKFARKSLKDIKVSFRDTYIRKDNKVPVRLFIYIKNKRVVFNTGVAVGVDDWDKKNQRIKKTHPEHKDYNLIIDNCKVRINDIFVRYRLQHKELTPERLKNEYETPSTYIDFYDFMEQTIKERKNYVEDTTLIQQSVVLNKLKKFRKNLTFSEINEDFIKKFALHLKRAYKNENNTIYNNLKNFKVYLNIAVKKGIINENPFRNIKLSRPIGNREYLTEKELTSLIELYNKNFLPLGHQRSLRFYLFSCFTSLRITDLRNLKMENIKNNLLIYIPYKNRNKKSKPVTIPICKPAKRIINEESPYRLYGYIFNMWTDQTINRHLKDIAGHLSIKKEITFHTARHTFATVFLRRTKNIVALKELLGHSDLKTTMIYAHILTDDLESEMKIFDNF